MNPCHDKPLERFNMECLNMKWKEPHSQPGMQLYKQLKSWKDLKDMRTNNVCMADHYTLEPGCTEIF